MEETKGKREQVFWDMIAFLIGGHESSAKTLTTALYQLKKQPDIEIKLKNEIISVLNSYGWKDGKSFEDIITPVILDEMFYLNNFVKEVL